MRSATLHSLLPSSTPGLCGRRLVLSSLLSARGHAGAAHAAPLALAGTRAKPSSRLHEFLCSRHLPACERNPARLIPVATPGCCRAWPRAQDEEPVQRGGVPPVPAFLARYAAREINCNWVGGLLAGIGHGSAFAPAGRLSSPATCVKDHRVVLQPRRRHF